MRDLRSRYQQALLGPVWTFMPPLIAAATFTLLRGMGTVEIPDPIIPYPLYVMFGFVLWQVFADGFQMPLKAAKKGQNLMRTIKMPIESLILASAGEMLFDKAIQILILAILFIVFKVSVTWGILLFPVAIFFLLALGAGLGLLFVPLGSLYTDIASAIPIVLRLWFFATPVLYPEPKRWPYSLLSDLNPVSVLLVGAQDLVIKGTLAQPIAYCSIAAVSILLLLGGWVIYRLSVPILIERS